MILTTAGASPVPVVPAQQSAQIQVYSVSIDLVGNTITVAFGVPGSAPGNVQRDTIPLPGALKTAIENHAQARVEAALAIAGTTITTP